MDVNQLVNRSYAAIRARGLITDQTTNRNFQEKIAEELLESARTKDSYKYACELIDTATVCLMNVKHLGFDVQQLMIEVIRKNEKRAQETKKREDVFFTIVDLVCDHFGVDSKYFMDNKNRQDERSYYRFIVMYLA